MISPFKNHRWIDNCHQEMCFFFRFVAVFFRGECNEENDDCDGVLAKVQFVKRQIQLLVIQSSIFNWFPIQLEAVDDELDEIGILLVSTPDEEVAQEHGEDT